MVNRISASLKLKETELREVTAAEQQSVIGGTSMIEDALAGLKLMGEILTNVAKTRHEISSNFARNSRA